MRIKWMASVMLAVTLFFAASANAGGDAPPKVGVGDRPPDIFGNDESGNPVKLEALKGKVVVLTFWATWCGYCLKELPVLENIQNIAGKDRIEVIAINYREDRDTYRQVKRKLKDLSLTLTSDPYGRIGDAYGVKGIPHMLMLDKNGYVAKVHHGYAEEALGEIADDLNELLNEPMLPE